MNPRIAASALVAAASTLFCCAAARGVEGGRSDVPPVRVGAIDQRAIDACVSAFSSAIHGSGRTKVRAAIPGYAPVFSDLDAVDRESSKVMRVEMRAYSANSNKLLAKSVCTVSINAIVLNLSVDAFE